MQFDPVFVAGFWSKVDRKSPDDCWNWLGCIAKNGPKKPGYGKTKHKRKGYIVTHVALILDGRPRPGNLHALHSCDNSLCVNPKHLRWGTSWDNAVDAFKSGHTKRTFTDAEAAQVRLDDRPIVAIANDYGCSAAAVSMLKRGHTYKHLAGL